MAELRTWNQYLRDDANPARRLRVQEELEQRYIAEKADEKLALIRQDMGTQYLALNQPDKAVEKTQQALEYYRGAQCAGVGDRAGGDAVDGGEDQDQEIQRTAVDFALDRGWRGSRGAGIMYRKTLDQIQYA
jgi:hypothetical protein